MLQIQVNNLFTSQLQNWELAQKNFSDLHSVCSKTVDFGTFQIVVQFNPARMVSSGAKVDSKTIAERPCFLCAENRPQEQQGVGFGDYTILVNPFPIFPQHFTIPRRKHVPQLIKPYFADMLTLAQALPELVIFYNGAKCGASAPDHMHFQAGTKLFLPVVQDYFRLKTSVVNTPYFTIPTYLRTVVVLESQTIASAERDFCELYSMLQVDSEEPMMNVVCFYKNNTFYTLVFPRANFRPWQYTAEGDEQLLVSPATVEMSGVFITPVHAHFERITKDDIRDILQQSTRILWAQ